MVYSPNDCPTYASGEVCCRGIISVHFDCCLCQLRVATWSPLVFALADAQAVAIGMVLVEYPTAFVASLYCHFKAGILLGVETVEGHDALGIAPYLTADCGAEKDKTGLSPLVVKYLFHILMFSSGTLPYFRSFQGKRQSRLPEGEEGNHLPFFFEVFFTGSASGAGSSSGSSMAG